MDVVTFLVEKGADVCSKKLDKGIPLHDAAWSGNTALVQFILNEAQSRNKVSKLDSLRAQNNMGETALHISAKRGHPQLVRLLLEVGDVTGIRDERGKLAHEVHLSHHREPVRASVRAQTFRSSVRSVRASRDCAAARRWPRTGAPSWRFPSRPTPSTASCSKSAP